MRGRTDRCPACGASWSGRGLRWCGRCGARLRPLDPSRPRATARWARPIAALAGVAVAIGAVVATTTAVGDLIPHGEPLDDAVVAPPSASAIDRIERRSPDPPDEVDGPVCVTVPDCFVWRAEVGSSTTFPAPATVTASGLLLVHDDDVLRATDVVSGEVAWERSGYTSPTGLPADAVATADLAIVLDGDRRLVALDLTDGSERWRTDPMPLREVRRHVDDGDQVRLVGATDELTESTGGAGHTGAVLDGVVAVDLTTGERRWEVTALAAGVGGDAAVLADDTALRGLDRDGEVVWEQPLTDVDRVGQVQVVGPTFATYAENQEPGDLRLVADGRPIDVGGHAYVVADDDEGAFGHSWGDPDGPQELSLWYVADGELGWQREPPGNYEDCGVELGAEAIVVRSCDGGTIQLARDDGRELGRTRVTHDVPPDLTGFAPPIGPYAVGPDDPSDGSGDLVVTDLRDGAEVARFPAPSHVVVVRTGDRATTSNVGGRLLIATGREVVALDLPD